MILVDLQQTAIANYIMDHMPRKGPDMIAEWGHGDEEQTELERMRGMLLRALRSYRKKFGEKYGDFILCCDSDKSWRKDFFPFYKIRRKQRRSESTFDWKTFGETFATLKNEFRENLPYRVLEAEGAEGDDVIAVMCEWNNGKKTPEPVLIYSSDQDFLQLQKYPQVEQYDKHRDRFLKCDNPLHEVRELIIRGDDDDDVPNILSADNCFAAKIRQKPMMTAKVDQWKLLDPEEITDWDDDTRERYARNKKLVDLSVIPTDIKAKIAQAFLDVKPAPRSQMYKYLMNTRAVDLLSAAGDF